MFEFLMIEPYEDRKIARDNFPWGFVSTVRINDGSHPYETAVQHSAYGDDMVIVDSYDTITSAKKGHSAWVKKMTAKKLPNELKDCLNAGLAKIIVGIGGNLTQKKIKTNHKMQSK